MAQKSMILEYESALLQLVQSLYYDQYDVWGYDYYDYFTFLA